MYTLIMSKYAFFHNGSMTSASPSHDSRWNSSSMDICSCLRSTTHGSKCSEHAFAWTIASVTILHTRKLGKHWFQVFGCRLLYGPGLFQLSWQICTWLNKEIQHMDTQHNQTMSDLLYRTLAIMYAHRYTYTVLRQPCYLHKGTHLSEHQSDGTASFPSSSCRIFSDKTTAVPWLPRLWDQIPTWIEDCTGSTWSDIWYVDEFDQCPCVHVPPPGPTHTWQDTWWP